MFFFCFSFSKKLVKLLAVLEYSNFEKECCCIKYLESLSAVV